MGIKGRAETGPVSPFKGSCIKGSSVVENGTSYIGNTHVINPRSLRMHGRVTVATLSVIPNRISYF